MGSLLPASWEACFPHHGKPASHVMGSLLPASWEIFLLENETGLPSRMFGKPVSRKYNHCFF
jgi:hypothetical protein